jgi:hypothetical protein
MLNTRAPVRGLTPQRRFLRKLVVQPNGCVTYEGAKQRGYGLFQVGNRLTRIAHRWWWEQHRGDAGETLDHLCRVKNCVRLEHLEPCGRGENARRGNVNTTTCKAGRHPWEESNIIRRPSSTKGECKACALNQRRLREGRIHLVEAL